VSGNLLKIVDFDSFSIGLTICYDLRFPELYSSLGTQSELVVNIACWPSQRLDHWTTLLKARAIENQIFMVGVNRIGSDGNGQHYMKSSMIFNPNGIKLEPIHSEDELDVFDLDISTLTDFKSRFSTTQDRKPEFYKSIL
jgi:predicted amidohydrolase